MYIKLIRKDFGADYTIGDLFIDDKFFCYILEDEVRTGPKVKAETAIPYGKYEIVVTMSNRFKRLLPLLLNVPGFEGIRIHPGNTDDNTEGCLLPGKTKRANFVTESRKTFDKLFTVIEIALKTDKVFIEITKGVEQNFV